MFEGFSRPIRKVALFKTESTPERIVPDFWSKLKPEQTHTPESYQLFLKQLGECTLVAEVSDLLLAWDIAVPETWEKVIKQSALQSDGEPDFSTISIPEVAERLQNIYKHRLELKTQYNKLVLNFPSKYFGRCEVRLLDAIKTDRNAKPLIVMPGCLTGAISLENLSVAAALTGRDVVTCDTAAPSHAGLEKFIAAGEMNAEEWVTTKTAVNAAYTESVELAMSAHQEGFAVAESDAQKYDLLGYSTSAAAVLQAALLKPEKVDQIVLLCPIGLNNKKKTESKDNEDEEQDPEVVYANVINILVSAAKHTLQNALLGEKNQNTREYFTGYIERQKWRGWSEVPAIIHNAALSDLTEAIYKTVVENRIPVSVLLGGGDKLFNPDEAIDNLEELGDDVQGDGIFNVYELGKEFTHNHIGRDPEKTIRYINQATTTARRMDRIVGV